MAIITRLAGLGMFLIGTVGAAAGAWGAPISTNTALPVSEGEIILRQQLVLSKASGTLNGVSRELTMTSLVSVAGYGMTPQLAVFGVAPLVDQELRTGDAATDVTGFGDAKIFVRYELFRHDGPGRTLRLASFGGVTLPTGRTGETGDGSTDVFGGVVLTAARTEWSFDGQVGFELNGEADGFERGDSASLDVSLQYRLFPRRISAETRGFFYGVLEANLIHVDEDRIGNAVDPNSGGTTLWIAPGVQYAARRWIAEAALRIPAATQPTGVQLEPDYTLMAGLRLNF